MSKHNIITSPLRACVADVMDAIAKHGPVSVCVDREGDLYVGARSPKAVLDAMTAAGVWLDDSQVDELTVIRLEPVHGGRIRVVVRMFEAAVAA